MAETRDLLLRFLGDSKDLQAAAGKGGKSIQGVGEKSKKTSKALTGMRTGVVALGAAIGAREVLQWANDAAKMADSAVLAADSLSKALGPAAQGFRDDLEDTRQILGLNSLEIDQLGSKFGLLLTGMGASEQAAADYAVKLVDLGGDLAAFRGELDEAPAAVDAMAGALRGEFDPLEQFGVKLSEAKVQAEILRLEGLDPLFASLDEGEKRLAAITGIIEAEAAPAMGALEDATDSTQAANNELSTEMEDLQIEMGGVINEIKGPLIKVLLAAWRAFETFFTGVGDALGKFLVEHIEVLREIKRLWLVFLEFAKGVGRTIAEIFNGVLGAINNVKDAIGGIVGGAQRAATAAGNILGKIPGFATGGIVGGPPGAPSLAVVHGGERISNRNATQRGRDDGPSMVINLNVSAGISNPQETARAIVDALTVYNRTNGSIPIEVSGTTL